MFDDADTYSLVRAIIALQAARGQTRTALTALQRDLKFQRMILAESRTLITKMVATARVKRDLLLLSEIIASRSLDQEEAKLVRQILAPLTERELDTQEVFRSEFKFIRHVLDHDADWWTESAEWTQGVVNFLIRPLYQRNATMNLMYVQYEQLGELGHLSSEQLYEQLASGRAENAFNDRTWSWRSVYNPVGKLLIGLNSLATWTSYIGRVRNLDAQMRLITLQHLAKQGRVSRQAMPEFIATAGEPLTNPYTKEHAHWDAAKHSISFSGLHEKTGAELLGTQIEVMFNQ